MTFTEAEPFDPPHEVATEFVASTNAAGSVTVTACVEAHPFASETLTVYVPAGRLEAVVPVPPAGDQAYVNGPVPPVTFTEAVPLLPPLQETFTPTEAVMAGPPILETAAVAVAVQPFASVIVTV